ncbi:hypothetical protein A2W14_04770 [Candidatus Gottesmanbacteria bacterium RBG_16_37_8]|uniref:VTT domain-containing protein n=1 Tax=Candidatus Gottesmanbacteria bacterium RBG_16_37_8 TaxID=1798371 RepID=A0A1F5YV32_9BACT|nr:MAG: hypothetical protein A2W14_04770 [Candidatus Gottesmanbacteria bacterium RBG_16_37_8]
MRSKKRSESKSFIKDGLLFRLLILAVSLALLLLIWINRNELQNLSRYGYIGIFVINFISASTIFLPAPGTASVFIGGAIWNPIMVGIVSGLGSSMGELFGYFLGYGSRGILKTFEKESSYVRRLEGFFHKSGFITTFIFAILPIPIFDIIGVIAGAVNYPVSKFFLAMVSARIIRNIIYALTGARIFS